MNWNLINRIRRVLRVSVLKTLYVNFSQLPFRQACKLPILVTRNVHLFDLSGRIEFDCPVRFAMVRFGFFGEDSEYWKYSKTLLKIRGLVVFAGEVHFGSGVVIRVEKPASLRIGNNTRISNRAKLIAYNSITIGPNSRIAWETQIIDTTFHLIQEVESGKVFPRDGSVNIGANNWIGNRASIMKGAVTSDFYIVAAGSLCNKDYSGAESILLAGTPAKLIKQGIRRVLDEETLATENNIELV